MFNWILKNIRILMSIKEGSTKWDSVGLSQSIGSLPGVKWKLINIIVKRAEPLPRPAHRLYLAKARHGP